MIGWYLLTALLAIPSLWAAARVRSTFHRYARVGVRSDQLLGAFAIDAGELAVGVRHEEQLPIHREAHVFTLPAPAPVPAESGAASLSGGGPPICSL